MKVSCQLDGNPSLIHAQLLGSLDYFLAWYSIFGCSNKMKFIAARPIVGRRRRCQYDSHCLMRHVWGRKELPKFDVND